MKKLIFAFLFLFAVTGVYAQDRHEHFIGVQVVRNDIESNRGIRFDKDQDLVAVRVATTAFGTRKNWGFTGETSIGGRGSHRNDDKNLMYTLMGGVTYKLNRAGKVQPFASAVAGLVAQSTYDAAGRYRKNGNVGFAVGGGVDVRGKKIGWRVFQLDYFQTNNFNRRQDNLRFATGVVF